MYHYTYTVDDDVTGAQIFADEARDEDKTHGMYEVNKILAERTVWELLSHSQSWFILLYLLKRKETFDSQLSNLTVSIVNLNLSFTWLS